jgi:hypothetical protein
MQRNQWPVMTFKRWWEESISEKKNVWPSHPVTTNTNAGYSRVIALETKSGDGEKSRNSMEGSALHKYLADTAHGACCMDRTLRI